MVQHKAMRWFDKRQPEDEGSPSGCHELRVTFEYLPSAPLSLDSNRTQDSRTQLPACYPIQPPNNTRTHSINPIIIHHLLCSVCPSTPPRLSRQLFPRENRFSQLESTMTTSERAELNHVLNVRDTGRRMCNKRG